jgi:hypothetical protein
MLGNLMMATNPAPNRPHSDNVVRLGRVVAKLLETARKLSGRYVTTLSRRSVSSEAFTATNGREHFKM